MQRKKKEMANLQVRDIDNGLYQSLKNRALKERRSISQEVIYILEKYLARPKSMDVNPTKEFLQLSGSWEDDRSAEEIVASIRLIDEFGYEKLTKEQAERFSIVGVWRHKAGNAKRAVTPNDPGFSMAGQTFKYQDVKQ
jgi:plasmid stability protein